MTTRVPLSVNTRFAVADSTPATLPLDEPHDGFVLLRRRGSSRLWFRMFDGSASPQVRPAPTQGAPAKVTEHPGTDELVSEMVRVVRSTGLLRASIADGLPLTVPAGSADSSAADSSAAVAAMAVDAVVVDIPTAAPTAATPGGAITEQVEWRTVQAGAPVFLLSAGPVLESSKPGPILGPGMRYRVTSVAGSVVGMEVMHANGDTRSGYVNAVDLRCIEPKIVTGQLASERGLTGRLRLTRLASTTFGLFGG